MVDTLPPDVTYESASSGCTHSAGTVTCQLGELLADTVRTVTITVDVPADLVYDNGGPKTISNTATVSNNAGPDSDSSNNADTETTQVVAVADVKISSVSTTSPLEVLIGEPATATVEVVSENDGPSSPIDAVLTGTANADAGASVTPADTTANVTALAVGSPQTTEQTFTLSCSTPGVKTVTFAYDLALANDEDTDPDLSNNTESASFEIDCVVPIAINIRPGGWPNSINPNTDAALTTAAGEYGLPVPFDATTIEADTVRFGLRSNLFNVASPSGAKEIHGRIHIEDAYELDERTRDGDSDAVLHFKPSDSGLSPTSTEGCLKGKFVSSGVTYTFLGCDSVLVRP